VFFPQGRGGQPGDTDHPAVSSLDVRAFKLWATHGRARTWVRWVWRAPSGWAFAKELEAIADDTQREERVRQAAAAAQENATRSTPPSSSRSATSPTRPTPGAHCGDADRGCERASVNAGAVRRHLVTAPDGR
jgi:hypothetical protein